jgi:Novel STAND NTPase 1
MVSSSAVDACLARNPYVGPRPFRYGEAFHGRDEDARGLAGMLISSRIVLLHSPSGAGKTSLIEAAIVPSFEKRRFQICAQREPNFSGLRVNEPAPDFPVHNRYVYSVVLGLVGHLVAKPADLAATRLVDALALLGDQANSDRYQLLILDQLEEVLTLDPTDWDGQGEFFKQIGDALEDDQRWGLLSMREDYMGGLDRFLKHIPGRLRATYRLDFLNERSAIRAIREPAIGRGVTVDEPTARKLVDDLRVVMVEGSQHSPAPRAGRYVEPVLLQVVCHRLWRRLCRESGGQFRSIGAVDVQPVGSIHDALRNYYADVVNEASGGDPAVERVVREWIGHQLITDAGFRSQKREGPAVPDRDGAVKVLQDRYLIRSDERAGVRWWELSHDRLIGPVKDDNTVWQSKNLEPWQIMAVEWHRRDEDEAYLLSGEEYSRARLSVASQGDAVNEIERRFVERSERKLDDERAIQSMRRRLESIIGMLAFSASLNVLFAIRAGWKRWHGRR